MSSQLHAYIENVFFIMMLCTFPADGSQTVVEETETVGLVHYVTKITHTTALAHTHIHYSRNNYY